MVYEIKFKEFKVSKGVKTNPYGIEIADITKIRPSLIKCTARKQVFDTLEKLQELRDKRWSSYLLPDESIQIEDIKIFEPETKEFTDTKGVTHTRKIGMKEFTVVAYKTTFCRNCGRLLTDPVSVARGIGPECIKHIGVFKLTNEHLDSKLKTADEKMQKVIEVLDKRSSKQDCVELIKENPIWYSNQKELEILGCYLIRRFE